MGLLPQNNDHLFSMFAFWVPPRTLSHPKRLLRRTNLTFGAILIWVGFFDTIDSDMFKIESKDSHRKEEKGTGWLNTVKQRKKDKHFQSVAE